MPARFVVFFTVIVVDEVATFVPSGSLFETSQVSAELRRRWTLCVACPVTILTSMAPFRSSPLQMSFSCSITVFFLWKPC